MVCSRCGGRCRETDAISVEGRVFCFDCAIADLGPPKACDPSKTARTVVRSGRLGRSGSRVEEDCGGK